MAITLLITILMDMVIHTLAGVLDLDGIPGIGIYILDGIIITLIMVVITTHMVITMDTMVITITTMQDIMMDTTEKIYIMEEELQQDLMLELLPTQTTEVLMQM
jgi:hypothetical protein